MKPRTTAALALLVLIAASLALLAAPAAASHGEQQADFTVDLDSHDTGAEDVSYELTVELTDSVDRAPTVAYPDRIVFAVEGANFDACQSSGFFGGTNYEVGVNQSTADGSQFQPYAVGDVTWDGNTVAFTFDDSDNDDQPNYGQGDTLELRLDSCVANAGDEGWYLAGVNVTGGSRTDRTVTFGRLVPAHYFGICDGCQADADARESMGNPPSKQTPTATLTPTATETPTPNGLQLPTETSTPVRIGSPTDTPTPSPAETQTSIETETDGAEGNGDPAERDPTDTEVFGMNPLAVVGMIALFSLGLAALGAYRV